MLTKKYQRDILTLKVCCEQYYLLERKIQRDLSFIPVRNSQYIRYSRDLFLLKISTQRFCNQRLALGKIMDKTIFSFFFIVFVFCNPLFAKTLTDDITFENSGLYLEPNVKSGSEYNTAGLQALWVFKHVLSIGITYNQSDEIESEDSDFYYDATFYGISTNYTFNPESLIHFNAFCSFDGGMLKLVERNKSTEGLPSSSTRFLELGGSGELNIAKYLRVAIGALYLNARHSLEDPTEPELSQWMLYIGLKFGVF